MNIDVSNMPVQELNAVCTTITSKHYALSANEATNQVILEVE